MQSASFRMWRGGWGDSIHIKKQHINRTGRSMDHCRNTAANPPKKINVLSLSKAKEDNLLRRYR
jgi:hypothetical protein